MSPEELAHRCAQAIYDDRQGVVLVVPGGPPRGKRIRLDRVSRQKCPMGEVLSWLDDPPRTVAWFDAIDVLAWIAAHGMVDLACDALRRAERERRSGGDA